MNTYTIRALTVTDAALVRLAGKVLTGYDTREGLIPGGNTYGTWDTTQAAMLAEHLRSALEIIERLTRPADQPAASFDLPEALAKVERSRVERMTGTGWPA